MNTNKEDQNEESLKDFLNHLKLSMNPKSEKKGHKFWDTQPINKETALEEGPIEEAKPKSEIKPAEYSLPNGYEWYLIDVNDEKDLKDTYKLLSQNYVEDDDCTFRFDYSPEFLSWALKPPGWTRDYHVAVRAAESKKLVGFISGVPANMKVFDKTISLVEINFLCVHKKLRSKRLAPVLIKEVTRRCHLNGIFQAVYTAGVYLPKPMVTCQYFHRSLAPQKLVEVGFSSLGENMTIGQLIKFYELDDMKFPGLEPMQERDVEQVAALLADYHSKFDFVPSLSIEEVRHWLTPIDNVIYSYVLKVTSPNSG